MTRTAADPSHIMQVGSGFWASKTLLSAVELQLFTVLGPAPLCASDVGARLGLAPHSTCDFLDSLVALGFLDRDGDGASGLYSNTPDTAAFLDKTGPLYIGGILEMFNARLYGFWGSLTSALRTGEAQNEVRLTGRSMFDELYAEPARLEQFMHAMEGISLGSFHALARTFDFSPYRTVCDVGGATGQLSIILAQHHDHLSCTTFDLPAVEAIAKKTISDAGAGDRVVTASGDFLTDELPRADIITMGMVLHDWDLDRKKRLIRSAYEALPEGGVLIIIENLIDDARRTNAFGLLMSLNMLIEFGDAFDFTGQDFTGWCREAGFQRTQVIPLAGPASAAVAYK